MFSRYVLFLGAAIFFSDTSVAQESLEIHINSLKEPLLQQTNPKLSQLLEARLSEYVKPRKYEILYWPNYPLSAEQIAKRDAKNDQPVLQKIAWDITSTVIGSLLKIRRPKGDQPKF
jgi:hypothetical protein